MTEDLLKLIEAARKIAPSPLSETSTGAASYSAIRRSKTI